MIIVEYTKVAHGGSNQASWNVDRGGEPFGQIWTFRARGEVHPYHTKLLTGEYETFPTLVQAKHHMELAAA